MEILSPKRKRILDFIARFINQKGYAPSVRDVVKGCGISSSSVAQYHLNVLEEQGHIRRDPEIPRSITLSRRREGVTTVPVLGTIAAGEPIPLPTEDTWHSFAHETVEVPGEMLTGKVKAYALRVKGTSMIDALVDDGDVIVLEATRTAEDGEMVAAWLTERQEATLKKLYREPGRIRLQPANRSMAPIYVAPEDIQVQGRVIAVLRKYPKGSP
jgi:repressor LexA